MEARDTRRLLLALLEDSGAAWREEMGVIRFRIAREGMTWEMSCRCEQDQVLCYGRFPFAAADRARCLERCNEINDQAVGGAMFVAGDGRPVFRTRAELEDPYEARQRLIRALEYNAAVVTRFWGRLSGV
ncbi:MAG TPA: hypothetical protein IAC21_01895 [Candidatus Enterenecus merdae]|nr:hypothetical protein [Candidatus Enterenecus merdae]